MADPANDVTPAQILHKKVVHHAVSAVWRSNEKKHFKAANRSIKKQPGLKLGEAFREIFRTELRELIASCGHEVSGRDKERDIATALLAIENALHQETKSSRPALHGLIEVGHVSSLTQISGAGQRVDLGCILIRANNAALLKAFGEAFDGMSMREAVPVLSRLKIEPGSDELMKHTQLGQMLDESPPSLADSIPQATGRAALKTRTATPVVN